MPACLQCGEENPEQARFCLACGSALRAAARGRAGAERKVVTVLFVDVVGFTRRAEQLDPEDVSRLIGPYYALVRGELERFGGTVEKFIGDAVMALFGAPAVHEDDAERALRAAFAIRQAIDSMNAADPELDLQVRIGVMSGVALVDLDADATRGETLATGDVVNTAARLQENAPTAGIVVGEPTRRLTADVVEYRELEPITAKGKHTPLRAWEAVLLRSRRDRGLGAAAPLVGRDEELELLLEAVESPPRFLTLVGAPGVGKSRLLWELAHALDARGGRFLWRQGRCLSYGTGAAYWGLGEVVKTHARILETDGAQTARRKLHDAVTRAIPDEAEAAWVEGHLRPLVGLGSHDQLSVDSRVEAFSAWRRFLEALAVDGTLVLVFEDLHWADEGLLDFAEHLAGWVRETPIVVICTARPELLEQRPDWPGVVRLEPLARDDTAALLDVLLERGLLADGVWDSVLDRAAGNPLYAVEYARMLAGRRMEGELPPPESLQAIVAARLDAIPPDSKRLLQDAAVVGKGFWAGALVAMSDRSYDDVERALVDLQRREFVRPHLRTSVSGESQYAFSHVLIRDVAYAEIPHARRAERHRRAAEWIESLAPDRAGLAEMLAHHYTSAIEYARRSRQETAPLEERARVVLREAGDRAFGLYAFPAAVGHYRGALDLWPQGDPGGPRLLYRYGRALFWAESGGEDVLVEARDALLPAGDREEAAEAEVMLSRLALTRGEREPAFDLARSAVSLLDGAPPSRARAEALSNLAALYALAGESEHALEMSNAARVLADELDLDEIRAHSLTFTGLARVVDGDLAGVADLEHAVEIAERLKSPEVVRSYANLASVLVNLGEVRRAWDVYAKAREAAERFGDARGLSWLSAERLYEHYWRGEWEDALALAEELPPDPESYPQFACRSVLCWIRLARDDRAGALTDSDVALDFARHAKDPQVLFPALALRARALVAAGLMEDAHGIVAELLELCAGTGFLPSFWTADLAVALRELGRADELGRVAEHAGATTRWLEAATLFVSGDLVASADLYAEIGALPEEALARSRAAGHGQLERALGFYRSVGADAYVRECEALLSRQA